MIAFYGWIFTFLSVWGLRWIIGIIGYNPTIRWWNCLLYSTGNPQIWAYNVPVFPVDVPFNQSIWHSFWNVFGSRRAKKGIRSWRYGGFLYPVGTPKLFILIGCSMMFHNKPSSYWGSPILRKAEHVSKTQTQSLAILKSQSNKLCNISTRLLLSIHTSIEA